MRSVEELLNDLESTDDDRRAIVENLADSSDERVLATWLKLLLNKSEEDIVRVEILKTLAFRRDDYPLRVQFSDALRELLEHEDDILVRQYAALAIRRFITNEGGLLDIAERVVANLDDDVDVRYNALDSIERNSELPICRQALERLSAVPDRLGNSAADALQDLE